MRELIRDVRSFLARVEYCDYEQLRGMEIVADQKDLTRIRQGNNITYRFKIHKITDLRFVFVEGRYIDHVRPALGRAIYLYRGVPDRRVNGMYFYLQPLAWWVSWRMRHGGTKRPA